ncbi:hypothetical protein HNR23_002244 [Nocardiopsis mwathae]|uniref:Prohead serine protease domain-containing protein n=1 Tax=Nocardiopsis mwathae TaxID=1472723 RepID=A0A7W9YHH4_9ACTN|nr:HK97 family phage prohead protease [Nocardiopsis mwathae]MBB6172184.1 hypothetical protein [Nocardiopsis mwathae]
MMRTKSAPVTIKAAGTHEGTEDGVFEAIVAAYNVDSVGDKISPGAFEKTLAEWTLKGDPIPVIWSHNWADPDSHIGVVEDAKETPEGLWVKARLDLDEPKAAKIYKLLKGRRVTQFSFGYEVPEGGGEYVEGKDGAPGHYALNELKLFEVGPCLVGANQSTRLESVKTPAGVSEERVREIVTEAITAKLAHTTPEPVAGPGAGTAGAEETHRLLTGLAEQVKTLTETIAHLPAAVSPRPADDDPRGKSAEPGGATAAGAVRAALDELTRDLPDLAA